MTKVINIISLIGFIVINSYISYFVLFDVSSDTCNKPWIWRPLIIRFYNYIFSFIGYQKISFMCIDERNLLETAINNATDLYGYQPNVDNLLDRLDNVTEEDIDNLDDVTCDDFIVPYKKYMISIRNEARLNPFGSLMKRVQLVEILTNRLKLDQLFKLYPEIDQEEIVAPVFITGLQRTGTSFLQRMFSLDQQQFRTIKSYEFSNPIPIEKEFYNNDVNGDVDSKKLYNDDEKRKSIGKSNVNFFKFLAFHFFAIHWIDHLYPEEDVLFLDYHFMSQVGESMYNVPEYSHWLEDINVENHEHCYEYLKKILKVIQWQSSIINGYNQEEKENISMLLKSPHHLEFLDIIFKVFPDAKVIHTHRYPLESVVSFISMVCHTRGIFSDSIDPEEVGKHWMKKTQLVLDRAMNFRKENMKISSNQFIDVYYNDLVNNTIPEMKRIYDFIDKDWNGSIDDGLDSLKRVKKLTGKHIYKMEDFNIEKEELQNILQPYIDYYNLSK